MEMGVNPGEILAAGGPAASPVASPSLPCKFPAMLPESGVRIDFVTKEGVVFRLPTTL